jgi:hypothetical protein
MGPNGPKSIQMAPNGTREHPGGPGASAVGGGSVAGRWPPGGRSVVHGGAAASTLGELGNFEEPPEL